ncbi:MAG: hypothetical protein RL514_1970 [Verrucomicrobiota bacterium]|jgi:hypothetical protein
MSNLCQTEAKQPKAESGLAADLSLEQLSGRIGSQGLDREVYLYVVRTISLGEDGRYVQQGCAPNSDGGRLSLCTCKHLMRSLKPPSAWLGVWIAGFTSVRLSGQNALFFLMQVGSAYASFRELWLRSGLGPDVLAAKSSRNSGHGDLHEPLAEDAAEFSPAGYKHPMLGHSHRANENPDLWHTDVNYTNSRTGRHSALLLGEPRNSFIWTGPRLALQGCGSGGKQRGIGRNHRPLSNLASLLHQLKELS